jgi:WhiB family redox-sensing transcriptional regulator
MCKNADQKLFFNIVTESQAVRICHSCPVEAECLNYALTSNISFGVWGGKTEKQRRSLRHQLRRASEMVVFSRRR